MRLEARLSYALIGLVQATGYAGGLDSFYRGERELHRAEEFSKRIALRCHAQRRIRRESARQRTDHLVEPVLRAALHCGKLLQPRAAERTHPVARSRSKPP